MAKKPRDDSEHEYAPPQNVEELLARARAIDGGDIDTTVVPAPTGISSFDASTGIGGVPRGRISLFQGEEHSGKTLLLLTAIAQAQRNGETCAFIDAERALTPSFATMLGVDWKLLEPWVRRPKTLDQACDLLKEFGRSGFFAVVGFDSVTALPTRESLETAAGDSASRAAIARMWSEELPKINALISPETAIILINQMRENPNPPNWWKGGKLLYTPGGKALRHYSSLTCEIKLGDVYKNGDVRVGQRLKTYLIKNKVGAPFTRAEFDLMYGTGLDLTSDMVDHALGLGVVRQGGSWFYITCTDEDGVDLGEKKYAGRKAIEDAIREDVVMRTMVQRMIQQVEAEV